MKYIHAFSVASLLHLCIRLKVEGSLKWNGQHTAFGERGQRHHWMPDMYRTVSSSEDLALFSYSSVWNASNSIAKTKMWATPCLARCVVEILLVPIGGLSKLSVNFFIDRLIAVQSASGIEKEIGLWCLSPWQTKPSNSLVILYGMPRKTCGDQCSSMHRSMKVSRSHRVLRTWRYLRSEVELQKICNKNFCDKHKGEEIKFFCRDCKIKFCTTCFIGKHNKHDCCEIEDLAKELKRSFQGAFGWCEYTLDQIQRTVWTSHWTGPNFLHQH